ncbi:plasmid mobilization relaxosome protein MobC [Flexithrix dorotheae]|uniref:plasmid mobilization relaxosome protein MobC n=1 Tax=Flexithrix dorotheae TaxID=70993 RepID=UPI0003667D90|nr:plasmid mobilization relaxosome protein MobC [Flexithrix dorotheae]
MRAENIANTKQNYPYTVGRFRLSESEKLQFETVRKKIGKAKVSDTEVFRYLLEGSKQNVIKVPVTPNQLKVWKQFIAVGNNINQIAKALNFIKKSQQSGDHKALKNLPKELEKLENIVLDFSRITHDRKDK